MVFPQAKQVGVATKAMFGHIWLDTEGFSEKNTQRTFYVDRS